MTALELIHLSALMELTHGNADVTIGLIDGPVAVAHPDWAEARIREVPGKLTGTCSQNGVACQHGTFVAGVLVAKRGSRAPAICPDCTLPGAPNFFGDDLGKRAGTPCDSGGTRGRHRRVRGERRARDQCERGPRSTISHK